MRNRIGVAATVLLACAFALRGQENMFRIDLVPSGAMVSLNQPILKGGKYVFRSWPEGAITSLKQARVRKITRLTGPTDDLLYQVDLIPSGTVTARDNPTPKGNIYVFHTWREGTYISVRQANVRKITPVTGDQAFRIEQGLQGTVQIANLPMQGTNRVLEIGTPPTQGRSSQAGPNSLSSVGARSGSGLGTGFYSSVVPGETQAYGNSANDYQVGSTYAYAPANAVQSSPGAPPEAPPQQ